MISLDENYTLKSDSYNWILSYDKKTTVKDALTGEEKEVTTSWQSYHGDLLYALQKYRNSVLKTASDITGLIYMIAQLDQKMFDLAIDVREYVKQVHAKKPKKADASEYPVTFDEAFKIEPKEIDFDDL